MTLNRGGGVSARALVPLLAAFLVHPAPAPAQTDPGVTRGVLTLSVSPSSRREPEGGQFRITVTSTRENGPAVIPIRVTNGSARSGSPHFDYAAPGEPGGLPMTLCENAASSCRPFPYIRLDGVDSRGRRSGTGTIRLYPDENDREGTESFSVAIGTLSGHAATNYRRGSPSSATLYIVNRPGAQGYRPAVGLSTSVSARVVRQTATAGGVFTLYAHLEEAIHPPAALSVPVSYGGALLSTCRTGAAAIPIPAGSKRGSIRISLPTSGSDSKACPRTSSTSTSDANAVDSAALEVALNPGHASWPARLRPAGGRPGYGASGVIVSVYPSIASRLTLTADHANGIYRDMDGTTVETATLTVNHRPGARPPSNITVGIVYESRR